MAISLDNISATRVYSSGDNTLSHATGQGANRILIALSTVQDSNHANMPIKTVTYAGLGLVKVRHDEPVGNVRTEIWYLYDPPVGTYNCIKDVTGALGESTLGVVTLFGADPILDANNGATGTSSSPSLSLTTVADNCWSLTVCAAEKTFSSVNNGQTVLTGYPLTDQTYENADAARKGPITPAGATTLGYTLSSSGVWALSAVSIQPSVNTFRTLVQGSI